MFNGIIPDPEGMAGRIQAGAGLVLILGPELTSSSVETLLQVPVTLERRDEPLSLTGAKGNSDPLLAEIAWTSAPQVRDRFAVASPAADLQPLVLGFEDSLLVLGTR